MAKATRIKSVLLGEGQLGRSTMICEFVHMLLRPSLEINLVNWRSRHRDELRAKARERASRYDHIAFYVMFTWQSCTIGQKDIVWNTKRLTKQSHENLAIKKRLPSIGKRTRQKYNSEHGSVAPRKWFKLCGGSTFDCDHRVQAWIESQSRDLDKNSDKANIVVFNLFKNYQEMQEKR